MGERGTIAIFRGVSPFTGGTIERDMQVCYPTADHARKHASAMLSKPLYLIHVREKPFHEIPARYWMRVTEGPNCHG